ncbi:fibrous sheath CABYR-binding protein [Drosophila elegans]|uniref:fibrous sheath CABYR-binding protein n=1 Tax=Drosophila elegans TaxID=30023 RepID=UPI0007E69680|nr:fibrous sheath CABYR-binding protein [Drosophila elegans]
MFENSLLIIKPDYLDKRRPVLLKLLAEGFQLQGNRRIAFSPESAAEFYADYADEKGFMLEVILLSKGVSEAFIVTKDNAVQELLNIMICYFGSASDLERNIHVTKNSRSVAREINFIFPNYIHEPHQMFDHNNFCNRSMLKPLIEEIYSVMQNVDCSQENWKVRLSDYLVRSNPKMPQISNQCQLRPDVGIQDKSQQTTMTYAPMPSVSGVKPRAKKSQSSGSPLSSTSPHSSMLLSSSSCVTCGGFERTETCISELDLNKRVEPHDEEAVCVDEEILWKEVVVYEEIQPEEEQESKEGPAYDMGEEGQEEADGSDVESDKSSHEAAPPPAAAAEDVESEPGDAATGEPVPAPAEVPPSAEAPPPAEAQPPAEAPTPAQEAPPAEAPPAEEAPAAEEQPEE